MEPETSLLNSQVPHPHLSLSWATSIQSMLPIPLLEDKFWYYPHHSKHNLINVTGLFELLIQIFSIIVLVLGCTLIKSVGWPNRFNMLALLYVDVG
jgi:hypothetical protein